MCHTQIRANIATDFGLGDSMSFVDGKTGTLYGESPVLTDTKPLTMPWYGNYYGTWQLADLINGTLNVPQATIANASFLASIGRSTPISLADLVQLDLGASYYGASPYSGQGPISTKITPPAGGPKVKELSRVYIGAPTAAQLLGLASTLNAGTPGWETLDASTLSGLVVRTGTGGSYITHSGGTIVCKGDIVISGTLFLNDVTIDTDGGGCRLYVTQSVFLQGRVRYTSSSGTQNLQISSARAIMMGFDTVALNAYNRVAIEARLGGWSPDDFALTRGPGTNSQKAAAILAEARVLGPILHDANDAANCAGTMVTYEAQNGGGSHRTLTECGIQFSHLLLNAPMVHSRYVGQVSGVVIAEIALFAPGALNFTYDPVFDSVTALPKLGSSVLVLEE